MKLIKQIADLNKAINNDNNLGFVPTMGCLHKGHEFLIKTSKKLCKKTIVSIFVNPTQFDNKNDYKNYPKNLNKDLRILRKLKVDFVYIPTVNQIYRTKKISKITLKNSQKILCAQFRKGHFEGVLNVLNHFIKLISPKIMFMGEKDYQQFFLVRNFISKKYSTYVYPCKTIRDVKGVALSSRNNLLNNDDLKIAGQVAYKMTKLKRLLNKKIKLNHINNKKNKDLIHHFKEDIINKLDVKIEYLECRNTINLSKNLNNKPFKIFIAYYLKDVRLIDNF